MDALNAALSHQVFGPTQRIAEGRVRSQAEGITEQLTIYTWPSSAKNLDADDKLSFLAFFSAYGRSEDASPSAWATWLFTYMLLCFPEFRDPISRMNTREYKFVPLPDSFIKQVLAVRDASYNYSDSQPEEYGRYAYDIHSPAGLPSLPDLGNAFVPNLAACATIPAIYGYCSLLIFLAGKRISPKNVIAITEKRPMNLIRAFSINEESAFILNGEGRMGTTAHDLISQAWYRHTPVRAAIITEVAAFAAGSTAAQRVVYTITKMIEYSGMQPAYFIHKFLQARPEVVSYTCTRPSLNAYISSVKEIAAAPSHLQPYYKLIHGDSTRAFHRNNLLVLSSCAITYEKYTSPSMNNFDLGEGATAAVNLFDAEASARGHQTLQSLTLITGHQEEAE